MRKLTFLVLILASLYGGYWVVGSRVVLAGVTAAMADLQAKGSVSQQGISLAGFPSRFDVTVTEPVVMAEGITWSAPFFQIFALSYQPNRIIAVWPREQSLTVGTETIALAARDMRASAAFGADVALPFDHAQMVIEAPTATSDHGWTLSSDQLRLAAQAQGDSRIQRIGAEALDLVLAGLGPDLPQAIERAHLDATVTFDRPLDRHTSGPPQPIAIDLATASILAGDLALTAAGRVEVGASGTPVGRVEVTAKGWRQMLAMAKSAGTLPAQEAANIERMLDGIARTSPDPQTVTLPFVFREGRVYLGPFPLGPAPRL